jgi:ATP synthase protein I
MDLTIPRVLMWQIVIGAVLAAAIGVVFGWVAGYSALLGSLTSVLPNAFLGLRIMAPRRDPGALKRAAWTGEAGKLALTVLMFTLVFTQVEPLSAAAVFAGFIITQLVVFSGLLMRDETTTKSDNTNGS